MLGFLFGFRVAELICKLIGHDPEYIGQPGVRYPGGEGHQPYACKRCKYRIYEICDEWYTRQETKRL